MRRIALLAPLLALLVACGSKPKPRAYYESTAFTQPVVVEKDRAALVQTVKKRLGERGVVRIEKGKRTTLKAAELKKQPLHVLQALLAATDGSLRGAEADLLVRVKGKGLYPVSIEIPLKGDVLVRVGPKWKRSKAPGGKALRERYGLGPLKHEGKSRWDEAALEALHAAMELLDARTRDLLVKLPFVRAPRGKEKQRGGEHRMRNCDEKLFVFDRAFQSRGVQFVGSPDAPRPAAAMTVLHELGHALHSRPGRLAFCEYDRAQAKLQKDVKTLNGKVDRINKLSRQGKAKKANALAKEIKAEKKRIDAAARRVKKLAKEAERMVKGGPVLAAYKKALGKKKAPTRYGESSLKESFAESFALYHADPEALGRLLPKVLAWFRAGGHLKALGPAARS